ALQLGCVLLVIPLWQLIWRTSYDEPQWWSYPFLNKRWLVALYGDAIATCFFFPSLFRRLASTDVAPQRWVTASGVTPAPNLTRLRVRAGAAVVVATSVAWLFAGPPWHMEFNHLPLHFHEQAHLGQLQALSKGYTPYVGPASTQYGPGSQILVYAFM